MPLRVGTIVKWYEPGISDEYPEGLEECESGICIGIITKITDSEGTDIPANTIEWVKPDFYVKWWEFCAKHQQIDPDGTGPYQTDNLWELGQTN